MSKQLKRIIPLAVLLVVLAGLLIGTKLLKDYNLQQEEQENEDPTISVLDKSSLTVTSLTRQEADEILAFSYINDQWVFDGDNHFPLDQSKLAAMAQAAKMITAQLSVDTTDQTLADYGLEEPALTVKATFSDGSAYTYSFGTVNKFNGYQYFTLTADDAVYMVEASLASSFTAGLDTLYSAEEYKLNADSVTAENVTGILLETASGTSKEISDASGIETLFTLVNKLDLSSWEDYYADAEEMQDPYGISETCDRITVSYTISASSANSSGETVTADVPASYTVYVGNKFELDKTDNAEADEKTKYYYFYSPEGSTVVYSADAETVDSIFNYLNYVPIADTADDAAK